MGLIGSDWVGVVLLLSLQHLWELNLPGFGVVGVLVVNFDSPFLFFGFYSLVVANGGGSLWLPPWNLVDNFFGMFCLLSKRAFWFQKHTCLSMEMKDYS